MKIDSPQFGSLDVDPTKLIEFPAGLPGFEQHRRFTLLHAEAAEPIVFTLQSLDDPDVAFSVTDPGLFGLRYELDLSEPERQALALESHDEVAVAVIVRRADVDGRSRGASDLRIAANVLAPIVINANKRRALQQVIARPGCEVTVRQGV